MKRYKIRHKQADGSFIELSLDTSIDSVYRVKDDNIKSLTDILTEEYAPKDNPVFTGSISLGRKEGTGVGKGSYAVGAELESSGDQSHAEGSRTTALGGQSHAEGWMTTALGGCSHAEGNNTIASGDYQHVQGKYNVKDTEGKYAHIVGNGPKEDARSNAHTLDWDGNAWFAGDVQANNVPYVASEKVVLTVPAATITAKKTEIDNATEDEPVQIPVDGSVTCDPTKSYYLKYNNIEYPAVYFNTIFIVNGDNCLCSFMHNNSGTILNIGKLDTTNITDMQLIEKDVKKLDNMYIPNDLKVSNSITVGGARQGEIGAYSSSFGVNCEASGDTSHAEGNSTTASNRASHAEGYYTIASGEVSHAEGAHTTASAYLSHAEGNTTFASGDCSHAEGYNTTASGYASHAEGAHTTASSTTSHAEGDTTTASGEASHVEGYHTKASSNYQHVQGKYNIVDSTNKYAHIVGNGLKEDARSNAHTLDWNGNGWYAGKLSQEGTPTDDKDVTTKKYVDDMQPSVVEEIIFDAPLEKIQEGMNYATNNPSAVGWATCFFDIDTVHEIQSGQIVYLEYGGNEFLSYVSSDKVVYFYAFDSFETDYNNAWTMPEDQILCALQFDKDINKQTAENKCLVRLWAPKTNVTGAKLKIKHKKPINDETFADDVKFWNSISMNRQKKSHIGPFSVAVGEHAEASAVYAIAMGNDVHARGAASISLGQQNLSQGDRSVTIGYGNRSLGGYSYSHGRFNLASAGYASATGYKTKATGLYATTSGVSTTASGSASIAEGNATTASGNNSHAEGLGTTAQGQNQHVEGKYNIADTANKYAHIVGNGASSSAKSNAHTLDWNGNGWYAGKLSQDGTPTEDKDLTTKKYVDDKDLIRKKYVDDKVAGIVDSAPETLDTLKELSTALGDDPNFATTVATNIGSKLNKPATEGTEGQVLSKAADGSNVWVDSGINEDDLNTMLTNTFGFVAE